MSKNAACKVWNHLTFVDVEDNGQTISVNIQFDVNTGPGPGAVFVNLGNEGNCEIELAYGRRVNGPIRHLIGKAAPPVIAGNVSVNHAVRDGGHQNDVVWFRVSDNNGSAGSVTIKFEVDYKQG